MKKQIICTIAAAMIAVSMFVGCNSTATMKDGTYRAEAKDYDSHGWKEYVVVTIKDGKYESVEFDAVDKDGKKKSEDQEYMAAYPSDKEYVKPDEYSKRLPEDLIKKQNIEDVDVIATATTSSQSFKKLVTSLKDNINKGITDTFIFDPDAK